MRNCIILAAGTGSRLYPLTRDTPKSLLQIVDKPLISWFIEDLTEPVEFTIVSGHCHEKLKRFVSSLRRHKINLVYNPHYRDRNNIYSLWLVRDKLKEGTIIYNADVLCHPDIITKVFSVERSDFLVIDVREKLEDEDMKVKLEGEKVIDIGKDLDVSLSQGEFIGISNWTEEGAELLRGALEALIGEKRFEVFYEEAFKKMIWEYKYPVKYITTAGLPWIEVDFLEDLKIAEEIVSIHRL